MYSRILGYLHIISDIITRKCFISVDIMLKAITTYVLSVLINSYISFRYSVHMSIYFQICDSRGFGNIDF